jgi:hypothetical protein
MQRSNVSGRTENAAHTRRGSARLNAASKARSAGSMRGRTERLRKTVSS